MVKSYFVQVRKFKKGGIQQLSGQNSGSHHISKSSLIRSNNLAEILSHDWPHKDRQTNQNVGSWKSDKSCLILDLF